MSQPLWRGLTHQEVYDLVHAGPGPYASDGAIAAWNDAEAALRRIDGDLAAAMRKAGVWEGAAAEAARDGLTPLGHWAVGAADAAGRAALSLQEHQEQVATARAALPEPGPAATDGAPILMNESAIDASVQADLSARTAADAERAAQAFHVMDTYATNTGLIQHWIPPWSAPPTVTVAGTAPTVAGPRPPARSHAGGDPGIDVGTAAAGVAPPLPGGVPSATGMAGVVPGSGGGGAGGTGTPAANGSGGIGSAGSPPAAGALAATAPTSAGAGRSAGLPAPSGSRTPPAAAPTSWRDLPDLVRTGEPPAGQSGSAAGGLPVGSGGRVGGSAGGRGGLGGTGGTLGEPWSPGGRGVPGGALGDTWSPGGRGVPGGALRDPWSSGGRGSIGADPWSSGGRGIIGADPWSSGGRGGAAGLLGEPGPPAGRGVPGGDPGLTGRTAGPGEPAGSGTRAAPDPRTATERSGYLPLAGAGGALGSETTHRRPSYLVDDSGAFTDRRWFPPAVITPDDPPPPP